MTTSQYDLLRQRLTAFFFNSRGDALRGEMYRVLALDALSHLPSPSSLPTIATHITTALGAAPDGSAGLEAVLSEELRVLEGKGLVVSLEGGFALAPDSPQVLSSLESTQLTLEPVAQEIRSIAATIAPSLGEKALRDLEMFFFDAANIIATSQVPFLTRSQATSEYTPDLDIAAAVSECRSRYSVDNYLDGDVFISKAFLSPTPVVNAYLYSLYQVSVSIHLLAWDPSLTFIRDEVLSRIELYLDTNILFVIMQPSNPLHQFMRALLRATRNDLGVRVHVLEATLGEYEGVLRWAHGQFEQYQRTLRDVARLCKRDGDAPADYLVQPFRGTSADE